MLRAAAIRSAEKAADDAGVCRGGVFAGFSALAFPDAPPHKRRNCMPRKDYSSDRLPGDKRKNLDTRVLRARFCPFRKALAHSSARPDAKSPVKYITLSRVSSQRFAKRYR